MRIIPFPSHSKKTEAKVQDWSQQEIADFYRAHRLLSENGVMIGIDRGVSDIGEPWMVFFDIASQDVFMHVARIDGVCHLICDTLGLKLSAANIEALVAGFENNVRLHLSIRAERNAKVVLHPAARIIMSISAVFLLFKLGNSEAQAKGLAEKSPLSHTDGGAVRPTEKSSASIARAQSAFSRAFETVDAPASAAIVASIILAGELSSLHTEPSHEAAPQKLPTLEHDPINDIKLNLQSEGEKKTVVSTAPEQHAAPQKADIPVEIKTSKDDSLAKDVAFTQQTFAVKSVPQDASAAVKFDFGQKIAVNETLNAQNPAPHAQDQAADANGTDAKRAMDEFLKKTDVNRPGPIEQKTTDTASPATKPAAELGNVSATSLSTLDDKVGFFMKTNLDLAKMYALMEHFAKAMGQYDFDYASGQVLIEEKNIANLSVHDVGIWTNVLGDGSTLSVIGHAGLIDDVLTFFS